MFPPTSLREEELLHLDRLGGTETRPGPGGRVLLKEGRRILSENTWLPPSGYEEECSSRRSQAYLIVCENLTK